jgi:hypothetical protein
MPTLRASSPHRPTDGEIVVFRSELPLRSRRHAVGFLRDTFRLKRVLDRAIADPGSGLLWYELTAHPLANRYATASAWRSEEDLRRFAADPVHVEVRRRQAAHLGDARFEQTREPAVPAG